MNSPIAQARVMDHRGFTLVELLVAIAVLGLLVVMLTQMMTLTGQAISVNAKELDAAGQARLAFDRLALDLAARSRRPDLGMSFITKNGTGTPGVNDSIQFYSNVAGYSGARQVTGVGYRIQQTTAGRIYQLERGAVGTDWGPAVGSNPFVQFFPNMVAAPVTADSNYDVLAGEVFRLEACYLLNTTGAMSNSNGSTLTGTAATSDFSHVTAIVVALGVLDASSRKLLATDPHQLQLLSEALPDNAEGKDPIATWVPAVNQPGFAAGVLRPAAQSVRVYERTFYVP